MVDESIVQSVKRYLVALRDAGIDVAFGVVFGSQALGQATAESDIDVLVVAPLFDPPRRRKDVDRLWHLAVRIDSRIEPIPCGTRQWTDDDSSAILELARREGQRVSL